MMKKNIYSLLSLIIITVIFTGCSGSFLPPESKTAMGQYKLTIAWPDKDKDVNKDSSRFFPSSADRIEVSISGVGLTEAITTGAIRPQTASAVILTVMGLPAGAKVAHIKAFDASSTLLVQRKESFIIESGKITSSGDVPLGVAIKLSGTSVVFEPSSLTADYGNAVPFQNWTNKDIELLGYGPLVSLPKSTQDAEGKWTYSSVIRTIDGTSELNIVGYLAPKCTVTMREKWVIDTVDSSANVGQYSSIAVDKLGYPAISYYNVTNGDLKVARFNGTSWTLATIDSADDVGEWTSIKFSPEGNIGISYKDITHKFLKYAFFDTSWHLSTVDSSGDVGKHSCLEFDSSGRCAISYYDGTADKLKYARDNGYGGYEFVYPDNSTGRGDWPSIKIDSSGNPGIAYRTNSGILLYTHFNGTTWSAPETVDGSSNAMSISLQYDSAGKPCIAYLDYTGWDLKYARYNGSTWLTETVDSNGQVGSYACLAFDRTGKPAIAYTDYTGTYQKLARFDGTAWQFTNLDQGSSGQFCSIVYDTLNMPHISYYHSGGSLKYARLYGRELPVKGAKGQGIVRALIIGINDYPGSNSDLNYCVNDANDFQASLENSQLWNGALITKLADTAAKKSAIQAAINSIKAAAGPNDTFVMSYSGHGTNYLGHAYMVVWNSAGTDFGFISDVELASWVSGMPCKSYFAFDSCYSGGLIGRMAAPGGEIIKPRVFTNVKGYNPDFKGTFFSNEGTRGLETLNNIVALSATTGNQLSYESSLYANGVFTYHLTSGLGSGGACGPADMNSDGMVTAEESFKYAYPRTVNWAVSNLIKQNPQMNDKIN